MGAWFRVIAGQDTGKTFALHEGTVTIGRESQNTIRLFDERVSRRHAAVQWIGDRHRFVDLNSANGVWYNGTKAREAALQDGDRIRVGDTSLVYENGQELTYPIDFSASERGAATTGATSAEGSHGMCVDIRLHRVGSESSEEAPYRQDTLNDSEVPEEAFWQEIGRALKRAEASSVEWVLHPPDAPVAQGSRTAHFQRILVPMAEALFSELSVERVAIMRRTGTSFLSVCFRQSMELDSLEIVPPLLRSLIHASIGAGKPLHVAAGAQIPVQDGPEASAPFPAICVPVPGTSEVEAILYADNVINTDRVFETADLLFVEALAAQLCQA